MGSLCSLSLFLLTFTSPFLTTWNPSPPEIKQMIMCSMTIAELYHFSDVDPVIRYSCKLHEELITKTFINRLIESRPPTLRGRRLVRSFSPALATFLRRLCLRRDVPASPPFRGLFLFDHRFSIVTALAYNMASSLEWRDRCNQATFTKHVNTLMPGVILLGELFEQTRARLASFVTDPANVIYFSNASPGIARRRFKIVQIQRDYLTNHYRFPAVHLLYATYSLPHRPLRARASSPPTRRLLHHAPRDLSLRRPRNSPRGYPVPEHQLPLSTKPRRLSPLQRCQWYPSGPLRPGSSAGLGPRARTWGVYGGEDEEDGEGC